MNLGMIKRRAAQKSLPYDAEIEYLKVTGSGDAYFRFNFEDKINYRKEFLYVASHTNNKYNFVAGTLSPTVFSLNSNGGNNVQINLGGTTTTNDLFRSLRNLKTTVTYNPKNTTNNVIISTPGQASRLPYKTPGSNTTSSVLQLFSNSATNAGIISIYYFKVYDENNTLILDLIPVRKGNIGHIYDTISGQLFDNIGTGSFILGPDK